MRVNTDYWGSLGRQTIDALAAYRRYILRSVTTYSRHIAVSVKETVKKEKTSVCYLLDGIQRG